MSHYLLFLVIQGSDPGVALNVCEYVGSSFVSVIYWHALNIVLCIGGGSYKALTPLCFLH